MKVTVELSENEIRQIQREAGEKKKGPAIRKFIAAHLKLARRREIARKFASGEWSAELPPIEKLRKDRAL
ncbi:MAG: hypothetical protein JO354_13865 [Verrucomicrobia bacterium]|nr:hypothetical protein [Verrucomicrobiota bacterium]